MIKGFLPLLDKTSFLFLLQGGGNDSEISRRARQDRLLMIKGFFVFIEMKTGK